MRGNEISTYSFKPPYEYLTPTQLAGENVTPTGYGEALVWYPGRSSNVEVESEMLMKRQPWLALLVVLPSPEEIERLAPVLRRLQQLAPMAVLPALDSMDAQLFRRALMCAPRRPAEALLSHVTRRGMLSDTLAAADVVAIVTASAELQTVAQVARRLATSRRTLGRHLAAAGLPAPSRWLQFARMFRAGLLIQGQRVTVARAARSAGYPDGFTLSNQMKRLIGLRPTDLRSLLGWEWIIEAWISREITRNRNAASCVLKVHRDATEQNSGLGRTC